MGIQDDFFEDVDLEVMFLIVYVGIFFEDVDKYCMGLIVVFWQEELQYFYVMVEMFKVIELCFVVGVQCFDEEKCKVYELEFCFDEYVFWMDVVFVFFEIGVWDYNIDIGELVWDEWMYVFYGCSRLDVVLVYEVWLLIFYLDEGVGVEVVVLEVIGWKLCFDM